MPLRAAAARRRARELRGILDSCGGDGDDGGNAAAAAIVGLPPLLMLMMAPVVVAVVVVVPLALMMGVVGETVLVVLVLLPGPSWGALPALSRSVAGRNRLALLALLLLKLVGFLCIVSC